MATSNWLILRAGEHPNVQALSIAVVGVRLFALVRPLARYAERLTGHDAALRLMASLRSRVFAALVPLVPLRGADLRRGELLRNFVADVDGVQDGVVRLVVPLAGAAATVTGAAAVGALIDPLAGLVVFVGLALAFVVAIASGRFADVKTGASLAAAAGERDRIATALVESLPELTVYGASAQAVNSLVDADETIRSAARSEALAAGVGTALTGGITAMTLAATLATAARDGLSGPSVGALAACVLVGAEAVGAVPAAVSAYGRLKGQLDRVMQLLSRDPSRRDPLAPQGIPSGSIGLTGAAITLAPQADAPAVLTDASVQVRPGQRTVVVGPSGSGKSTLLTSMLGLIPVSDGTLDINGSHESVALDDVAELDLRPRVAGSLQGDHVFDVSLRDNLRFVRPTADDAELETVAIRAGLSSFIAELPDGWDTRAGIDGSLLSGGQRQRLLIARALLADPDILVLDEPTAHLDEETERAVLTDLFAATGHRTLVMSSHRAAALVGASAVAHVVDGTIRQAEVPPTPPTKAEHKTETRPRHD
jgi:thiol reductant ABC exporter CydC subunit